MHTWRVPALYLIRHGQVINHHEYRYVGHTDVDITDLGIQQMENIADFLLCATMAAVYSSDLKRSVKGGEMIGGATRSQGGAASCLAGAESREVGGADERGGG